MTNVRNNETILEVHDLSVDYGYGDEATHAVRNVELRLARGEFVGLVGESGSGKSTLGFALTGQWALLFAPGLCIALLATSLTLINFGVDGISNPRLREGTKK